MSYQIKKHKKVILEPLSTFNDLFKKAETLYNIEQNYSKTSRNSNSIKSELSLKSITKIPNLKSRNIISERLYKSNTFNSDHFNIIKTIKTIKKNTHENFQSNDPFLRNKFRIGFDKKNSKYVFEPGRQIFEYKKRRANILIDRDGSINKFLAENKGIGLNNYIIKYLNNESEKLIKKEEKNDKKIEEGELNNYNNNKNFLNYIHSQNEALKKIENSYYKLGKIYRTLLKEEYLEKINQKTIDDEMEKILNNLEELRIICKFITEITKGDSSKFNNVIIEKENKYLMHLSPEKFDFNKFTTRAIQNYNFCLENNEKEENELNEILKDDKLMEDKFNEVEVKIIKLLDNIQQIQLEHKIMRSDIENNINEINERLNFHEKEYEILKEMYYNELESIKKMPNSSNKSKFGIELIEEIYNYILECEGKINKINYKLNTDLLNDCINKIKNQENKINFYLNELEIMEMQDPHIFIEIINTRKNYNKDKKQIEKKKQLDDMINETKEKSENRFNKIIIKSRKTEPPFRRFKKIIKKDIKKEYGYNPEYDMILYK